MSKKLKQGDIRKFSSDLREVLMAICNRYNIEYRMQKDGVHINLYNGQRGAPFKVSANAKPEQQLTRLMAWCERWVPNYVDEVEEAEKVTEKEVRQLAEKVNTRPVADTKYDEIEDPVEAADAIVADREDEETVLVEDLKHRVPIHAVPRPPPRREPQRDPEEPLPEPAPVEKTDRSEAAKRAAATRAQRTTHAQEAVECLAEYFGIRTSEDQRATIDRLNKRIAELEEENSQLKARVSLIREAMRA